jgi:hypothetical protein
LKKLTHYINNINTSSHKTSTEVLIKWSENINIESAAYKLQQLDPLHSIHANCIITLTERSSTLKTLNHNIDQNQSLPQNSVWCLNFGTRRTFLHNTTEWRIDFSTQYSSALCTQILSTELMPGLCFPSDPHENHL